MRSIAFVWVAAPRALWPQTGPDGLVRRAIRQTTQADTTSWLCRGPELASRRPRRNTIEHCLGCCFVKVEKIGNKRSSCGDRWAKLQPDLELKTCIQCGKTCWRPNMYDLCISCFFLSMFSASKHAESGTSTSNHAFGIGLSGTQLGFPSIGRLRREPRLGKLPAHTALLTIVACVVLNWKASVESLWVSKEMAQSGRFMSAFALKA